MNEQTIDRLADKTIDLAINQNQTSGNLELVNSEEIQRMDLSITGNGHTPVPTNDDYVQYFKRPVVIARAEVNVSDTTAYRTLHSWPTDISSVFNQKLQGVFAFRSDVVVRLVVNANKMQAGRLRISALPSNHLLSTSPGLYAERYFESKSTISTLPNAEIDLACSSEVELRLPWCFSRPAVRTTDVLWHLCVELYTPLRTGTGSSSFSWTMYVHHENFETYGSSGRAAFQSALKSEKKEAGLVSHTLQKFVRTFNSLQPLPFVGQYMSTAAGISKSLVNAANVWGLSAPSIRTPQSVMVPVGTGQMASATKMESARYMGIDSQTSLPVHKFTGSEVDEMAISHILSKPSYFTTFTWNTSASQDTFLFSKAYRPIDFYSVVGSGKWGVTPLAYLAQSFLWWRGGIKLRVKFSRTPFHTGRIMFVFFPVLTTSLTRGVEAYRKIVDISETSEVDIIVPYVHVEPFLKTSDVAFQMEAYVVDILSGPSTVSSTIDVVMEVCGADDFVFSTYVGKTRKLSFPEGQYADSVPMPPLGSTPFTPQSGCIEKATHFEPYSYDPELEVNCASTVVRSLRPMLKTEQYSFDMSGINNNAVHLWGATNSGHSYLRAFLPMYYGYRGSMRMRVTNIANGYDIDNIVDGNEVSAGGFATGAPWSTITTNIYRAQRVLASNLAERSVLLELPYETNLPFVNYFPQASFSQTMPIVRLRNAGTNANDVQCFISTGDDFDCQFFLGIPTISGVVPG